MRNTELLAIPNTSPVTFLLEFQESVLEGWYVDGDQMNIPLIENTLFNAHLVKEPTEKVETKYIPKEIIIERDSLYTLMLEVQGAILQGYRIIPDTIDITHTRFICGLKRQEGALKVLHNSGGVTGEVEVEIPLVQYYSQPIIKSWDYATLKAFAMLPEIDSFHREKAQMVQQVWKKLRILFKQNEAQGE